MTSTTELRVDTVPPMEGSLTDRRPSWFQRIGLDTAYTLTAFFFAVPMFVVVVTGLALGVSLLVLLFGVPVLAATVHAARGFAHVERTRIQSLLADEAPTPEYAGAPAGRGWLGRAAAPLRDPQSWFDVAWTLASFVTSTVVFCVTVAWWALALGGLSYWFWQQFIPFGDDNVLLVEVLDLGEGRGAESWLMLVFGVVGLLTLPLVLRVCALAQSGLGKLLLSSRPVEPARVDA